jgi:hypothetical protein
MSDMDGTSTPYPRAGPGGGGRERRAQECPGSAGAPGVPASAELGLLPDTIGFGIAVVGAVRFAEATLAGRHEAGMDARLDCLRNRLEESGAIAEIAARHLVPSDP